MKADWSKATPIKAGWYWYRHSDGHEPSVLHVFLDEHDNTLSVRTGDYADQINFLENFHGEWCGPIARPSATRNAPLKAEVIGGLVLVSIGVETLEWASRPVNGGTLRKCRVDGRQRNEWARDVVREMVKEDEVGNSPLNEFLDTMMEAAADSGSVALIFPKKRRRKASKDRSG